MNAHRPLARRRRSLFAAIIALAFCAPAVAQEPERAAQGSAARPDASDVTPAEGRAAAPPPPAEPPGSQPAPPPAASPSPPGPAAEPPPEIPPPVVPVPEVKKPPSPDAVFSGHPVPETPEDRARENSWFDASRSWVGRVFFSPVVKLDRFFSDATDLDPERAQSFARLRGGLKLRQHGKPIWSGDLLAQVYMPGVDSWLNRFRLVLTGVSDTTQDNVTNDTGTTTPLTGRRVDPANLELRFGAFHGIRSSVDVGAGILFRYPPGAFTRARYRIAIPIDDLMVSRTSYQVFWRSDMHLGTRLTSAIEWPLGPSSMLRLGGSGQVAQRKTEGIEYGTELVYSHAFTQTFAVAAGADAVGDSHSRVTFGRYRVFTRMRHDVLRRWIFVEAEPEVAWPWTPDRGRYQALGVTFRVEVQFEGDGAVSLAH